MYKKLANYNDARFVFKGEKEWKSGNVVAMNGLWPDPSKVHLFGLIGAGNYKPMDRAVIEKKEIDPQGASLNDRNEVVLKPRDVD